MIRHGIDDRTADQPISFVLPVSCTRHVFTEDEFHNLEQLLVKLKVTSQKCTLNSAYCRYKLVTINKIRFSSSSKQINSIAVATWNQIIFGESQSFLPRLFIPSSDTTLRPVRVNYVLKLTIIEGELFVLNVLCQCFKVTLQGLFLENPLKYGVEICLREMAFILLYVFISCLVGVLTHVGNSWRKPISCSTAY